MAITAIIVTHNSVHIVGAALACVAQHPRVAQCIVVDNGSSDGTPEWVAAHYPGILLIREPTNHGFGAGCNAALARVETPFALLLNPDATMDAASLDRLRAGFDSYPDAAILAPHIDGHPGGVRLPIIERALALAPLASGDGHATPVAFISGAVAMWRMEAMRAVGFFDPAFFLFYEDDDIALRVRRAGYTLRRIEQSHAEHHPGQSCGETPGLEALKLRSSTWSYLYIHRKYCGRGRALSLAMAIAAEQLCGMGASWRWRMPPQPLGKPGAKRQQEEIDNASAMHERRWRARLQDARLTPQQHIAAHEAEWAAVTAAIDARWARARRHAACRARLAGVGHYLRHLTCFGAVG